MKNEIKNFIKEHKEDVEVSTCAIVLIGLSAYIGYKMGYGYGGAQGLYVALKNYPKALNEVQKTVE